MSQQKPFRVETLVDAAPDAVWKAVTDPKSIKRWYGWEHASFDDEIDFVFVDGATRRKPIAVEMMGGQTLELEADEARTMVRAVRAGTLATTHWRDVFDAVEEGWRTSLNQLRYYLEHRLGAARRTVHLEGDVAPAAALALAAGLGASEVYHDSRFQRALLGDPARGELVVVAAEDGVASEAPTRVTVNVSAYGLAPADYAPLRQAWAERWEALVPNGVVTP